MSNGGGQKEGTGVGVVEWVTKRVREIRKKDGKKEKVGIGRIGK
jgi:hypothetical protein